MLGLELRTTEIVTDTVIAHRCLKPGSYLKLTVCDTGHGMSPETLERIFDPYFTTKEVGKGSGLGLAVVQGVIDRHEGAVEVYSEPGEGTTFHVYLPGMEDGAVESKAETGSLPVGVERILFVDDEQNLVDVGEGMLKKLGYRVDGNVNCLEALEFFRAEPDRYDLIITDYTMPRMNGIDFSREIIGIRPDIPIILCTGFSEKVDEEKVREACIRTFAMKPLNLREIADLVRKVLDG